MRFIDGYWLVKPQFKAHYCVEYFTHDFKDDCLTIYVPTSHMADRGSVTDVTMLTVSFTAPMPGVIRVRSVHFEGDCREAPVYAIHHQENFHPTVEERDEMLIFKSGDLEARISKRPMDWRVDYYQNGRLLTGSGRKNMGYMYDTREDRGYMQEQLLISPGEYIYGLGERFTAFVKNGQSVSMWNEDGGSATDIAYKNVPLYLSNRGYGVFVDDPGDVQFEVGSETVTRVQFSLQQEDLAYCVIAGPTMKDVLGRYGRMLGMPALPPAWSFGLWLSACFTPEYNQDIMNGFLTKMEDRGIPVSVFHFDPYWMKPFEWVSLEWDKNTFPDPKATLDFLKAGRRKNCLWINPYIGQKSPLFREGREKGYLLKKTDGRIWQTDRWQPGMAIVDFTNPEAREWFAGKLADLVDLGTDCFKTDFGERIPVKGVQWYDGSDPVRMHNYYTYLYNKTVFDMLRKKLGRHNACVFARSGVAGSQQFPVHWGGDCSASYPSMAETLRGGLSLAMAGFGFWSHDISGFENTATPDLYKRWCAFGLLSSHSRLHGNHSYRVPWLFDEESCEVLKKFTRMKMRMMPYLYAKAVESTQTAVPMMRPMVMEFEKDYTCHTLDMQYMLGDQLLVAPIFNEAGLARYYLPEGRWTHYFTGEVRTGGKWFEEYYDYFSLPLYVRENGVIPTGNCDTRPDYDYFDDLTYQLYEISDGAAIDCTVYDVRGENPLMAKITRAGTEIQVRLNRPLMRWKICINGRCECCEGDFGSIRI